MEVQGSKYFAEWPKRQACLGDDGTCVKASIDPMCKHIDPNILLAKYPISSFSPVQSTCFRFSYLVGGFNPSEKYKNVTWDDDIPNIWTVIKFHGSKPPTSMLYLNRTCWAFGDMFPYFGEVVLRSP